MRKYLSAFTLAEVLITLGIIGVVAVLTMPSVISNYNKRIYVTSVQKVYNQFSDAALKYLADSRTDSLAETDLTTVDGVKEFLSQYFKVSKFCGSVKDKGYEECFADSYKTLDQKEKYEPDYHYGYCVILNTGAAVCMDPMRDDYNGYHGYADVIFDINGKKAPNVKGRDLFAFEFYSDGKVSEGYNMWTRKNYCVDGVEDSGYAAGCFSKIMNDGWSMDY